MTKNEKVTLNNNNFYNLEDDTQTTSTTQLTDPLLYSIYGGRNQIYSESQEYSSYKKNNDLTTVSNKSLEQTNLIITNKGGLSNYLKHLIKISIASSSIIYMFQSVHLSNPNTIPKYNAFQWINYESNKNQNFNILLIFLKIVLSSCILDKLNDFILFKLNNFKKNKNNNISISNNQNKINNNNVTVLQLLIAILGIVFGFKKINWNVTTEASLALLLVNIFFTKYLGCTINENYSSAISSIISFIYDYYNDRLVNFNLSCWRYLFLFFLSIIFIKFKSY